MVLIAFSSQKKRKKKDKMFIIFYVDKKILHTLFPHREHVKETMLLLHALCKQKLLLNIYK